MIKVTFPDGNNREYPKNITGLEIASSISKSLAKNALIMEVDGVSSDLNIQLQKDCTLKIITIDSEEALDTIRHDCAHLLAQAAKELYGNEIQVTIGPSIENGFYYDFVYKTPFSTHDLSKLEDKMREIAKRDNKFVREVWNREEAIQYFKSIGEHYKVEIIESIPENENLSIYRQGEFLDLCRGPHGVSTGYLKHFKLMKVSGAYWRGDSKNEMLQRVYGTAWATKEQLDKYLFMLEEAEKRYHVRLGKELDLFHLQEEARGMVFWHDKGWTLYRLIEEYIRSKIKSQEYIEVKTPMLLDKKFWEMSGHWDMYQQNMFTSETQHETLAFKPMNCPCHVQIFNQGIVSYKDLPIRMAEFGSCHRYEPSGALHGLMRVRSFVQDDAHIFCMENQISEETLKFCNLLREVYSDFGFQDIKVKFSDRPDVRAGSDSTWDKAESALRQASDEAGLKYTINKGEGAFYGPKLEFVLTDALGREWQCGTLQVDFVLPERLGAFYVDSNGTKKHPVMLHRAIIGSFERFIGILIEHYAGKFPLWLAPTQICIATVTNETDDYALHLNSKFINAGIRSKTDLASDKIGYKIRHHSTKKVPIIVIVGKQEAENNKVNVRMLDSTETRDYSVDEFIALVQKIIYDKK